MYRAHILRLIIKAPNRDNKHLWLYTEPMTLHLIEMTLMCMHQVKELKLQVMGVGALEEVLVYKLSMEKGFF